MDIRVVNLKEKAKLIKNLHKYKLIAELNNYQFKLVKAKRTFIFHAHDETDEVFFVIEGKMKLEIENNIYPVNPGELIVVPKGKVHRPICEEECTVMLIEPKETLNTGNRIDVEPDLNLEWI
ncbi:MAG: cupin [Firmicutes bacterium]|nr:cupin [Bacillota bacterium]